MTSGSTISVEIRKNLYYLFRSYFQKGIKKKDFVRLIASLRVEDIQQRSLFYFLFLANTNKCGIDVQSVNQFEIYTVDLKRYIMNLDLSRQTYMKIIKSLDATSAMPISFNKWMCKFPEFEKSIAFNWTKHLFKNADDSKSNRFSSSMSRLSIYEREYQNYFGDKEILQLRNSYNQNRTMEIGKSQFDKIIEIIQKNSKSLASAIRYFGKNKMFLFTHFCQIMKAFTFYQSNQKYSEFIFSLYANKLYKIKSKRWKLIKKHFNLSDKLTEKIDQFFEQDKQNQKQVKSLTSQKFCEFFELNDFEWDLYFQPLRFIIYSKFFVYPSYIHQEYHAILSLMDNKQPQQFLLENIKNYKTLKLIPKRFWDSWKSSAKSTNQIPRVYNSYKSHRVKSFSLKKSSNSIKLRNKLRYLTDFLLLPSQPWALIQSWYYSPQTLERPIIEHEINPSRNVVIESNGYYYQVQIDAPVVMYDRIMEDGTRPIPGNYKKKGMYKFHRKYAGKEKNMTYDQQNLQIVFSRMDTIEKVKEEIIQKFKQDNEMVESRLWIGKELVQQEEYEEHLSQFMIRHNLQTQKFFIQFARQNGQWPTQNLKKLKTTQFTSALKANNQKTKGLVNLGNTCYFNSALQCIFNTPFIRKYLANENLNYLRQINKQNLFGFNGFLIKTFARLLESSIDPKSGTSIAPRQFKKIISVCFPQFRGNTQQDAQEFLVHLIDGLHQQVNLRKKPPYILNPQSQDRDIKDLSLEFYSNHLRRNWSFFSFLFNGQFKNQIKCANCGKQSITFDPFSILSLPIQDKVQCTVKIQLFKLPPNIRDILSGNVSNQFLQNNDQCDTQSVITQLVQSVRGGISGKIFASQSRTSLHNRNSHHHLHHSRQDNFTINNSSIHHLNRPVNENITYANNNKINLEDPSPVQLSFIFPRHTMGGDIIKKLELLQDLDLLSPRYRNKNRHFDGPNIPQAFDIGNVPNPQPIYQRLKHMTDIVLYVAQGYSRPVVLGQLNSLGQLLNVDQIVLLAYQVLTPIGKDFIVKWYLDNQIYLRKVPDSPYQIPQKLMRIKNSNNSGASKRRQPHQPGQKSEKQQSHQNTQRMHHQQQNSVPDNEKQLISPSSYFNQFTRFTHMQPDPRILFSNWVVVMGVIRVYSTIEDDIFTPRIDYKNDTVPLFFLVSKDITGYELYQEVYARMQHKFKPDSKYRLKKNLWWIVELQEQELLKNELNSNRKSLPNSIENIRVEGSQLISVKNTISKSNQYYGSKNNSSHIENEQDVQEEQNESARVQMKLKSKFSKNPQTKRKLNQGFENDVDEEDGNITSGVGDEGVDDVEVGHKIEEKNYEFKKKQNLKTNGEDQDDDDDDDQEDDEQNLKQQQRAQQQSKHEEDLQEQQDQSTIQQKKRKKSSKISKITNSARKQSSKSTTSQQEEQQSIGEQYYESTASKIEKQVRDHKPFFIRMINSDYRTCGVCKKNCNGCILKPDFSQNQFDIQNHFNIVIQMSYTNYSEHVLETGVFSHQTSINIQKEKDQREKKNISNLNSCLKRLTDKQVLQGKDAAYCSSCKQHQKHEKTLSVFKLPPILIFHFKSHNSKITTIINFPLHGLNMNEFLDPDQEKVYENYDLYAVLNHYGSLNSGHYTACIMDQKGDWSYYDDSESHPMPNSEEVRSQYAYMLFYKQRGVQDKQIEQIFPSLMSSFTGKPIKFKNQSGYICEKSQNKLKEDDQHSKIYQNKALIQSIQKESPLKSQTPQSIDQTLSPKTKITDLKIGSTFVQDIQKERQQEIFLKLCEAPNAEMIDRNECIKVAQSQLDPEDDEDFIDNSECQVVKKSDKKDEEAKLKEFVHEREENLQREKTQNPKTLNKSEGGGGGCSFFSCNCSKKNKGDSKNSFNSQNFQNEQSFS